MKTRLVLSTVAAALALALAAPAPGFADSTTATTTKVVHRKHHPVAAPHSSAYSGLERYRSSGFVGQFPGSCAYDRAAGNCVIDLGYGRCMDCSSGPFN
jgi:hypothetical protein